METTISRQVIVLMDHSALRYWSIAGLQRILWATGHDVGPVATKWIEAGSFHLARDPKQCGL